MARIISTAMSLDARIGGTAATTSFDSAQLMFRDLDVSQVDTATLETNELRETMTDTGVAIGRQLRILRPGLTLQSYGSGTAASWRLATIFRLCGLSHAVSGGTVSMRFRSDGFESGALAFHQKPISGDGVLHRATGVYGNCRISAQANQLVTVQPELRGIYAAPISQATPTITLPGNNVASFKNAGCTITPAGGGAVTPIGKSFDIDFGWPVNEDEDFNAVTGLAGLIMGKRNPTFNLTIGLDSADVLTWANALSSGTLLTTVLTHTDSDGGKVRFTVTSRLLSTSEGDSNNYRTITLNTKMSNATADQEFLVEAWKPAA